MHDFIDWLTRQGHDMPPKKAERIAAELFELAPDGPVTEAHVEALASRYRKRFAGPRAIMMVMGVGEELLRWQGIRSDGAIAAQAAPPAQVTPPSAGSGQPRPRPQAAAPAPIAPPPRHEPAPVPIAPPPRHEPAPAARDLGAEGVPDNGWDAAGGMPDLPPLPQLEDVPLAEARPDADAGYIGGDVDPVGLRDPFADDPSGDEPQVQPAWAPISQQDAPIAAAGDHDPFAGVITTPPAADNQVDPVHGRDPFSDYPEEEAIDLDIDADAAAISDRAYYLREEVELDVARAAAVDLNEDGEAVGDELDVRDFGALDPDASPRKR